MNANKTETTDEIKTEITDEMYRLPFCRVVNKNNFWLICVIMNYSLQMHAAHKYDALFFLGTNKARVKSLVNQRGTLLLFLPMVIYFFNRFSAQ